MKVIDLTHVIENNMPVYPGTEQPSLEPVAIYEKDGFKETRISMTTHTGTHMDSPAHIYRGSMTLDAFPADQFIGKALVIDCTAVREGGLITMDALWDTEAYFGDYPCIDEDVLDYILAGDYKGVGFDAISIDPITDENITRHKKLFENKNIVNIENLCNLGLCGSDLFWFSCFPLKINDSDGSPIRAVAWFE